MFSFMPNQDLFVVDFACHDSDFYYRDLENSTKNYFSSNFHL